MEEADSVLPSFETTVLPHLDAAYNLAHWLLRNSHDAEDSVQESCLRAWKAYQQFRGGDARPWFLTIVRHVCYTKLQLARRKGELAPFDEEQHGFTNESPEAIDRLRREADGEVLKAALEQLSPEYREVVVLHDLEGLGYKEIAGVANIPIGTVMSRLSRARARLQHAVLEQSKKT